MLTLIPRLGFLTQQVSQQHESIRQKWQQHRSFGSKLRRTLRSFAAQWLLHGPKGCLVSCIARPGPATIVAFQHRHGRGRQIRGKEEIIGLDRGT